VYPYAQEIREHARKERRALLGSQGERGPKPLRPSCLQSRSRGYKRKGKSEKPSPYYGYYFKILKAQGKHAPGGAYDYVVKGT